VAEGYGMPEACAGLIAALVGRAGYHCFLAWGGERPTGAGALPVVGQSGWCGVAATLPEARGRGAQNALLAARICRAAKLGCTAVYTETNLRPNWLLPG
jgi:GNAT superfamily N-acetyltransferase